MIDGNHGSEQEPASASGDFGAELIERLAGREKSFGRYRLEGELARGGQGAILRVWDEDLRRNLAMKVTLAHGKSASASDVDPRTLGRFLEEAQVTGQLEHPGIVPVHELGLDDEGRVYFTMQLVKGIDLARVFEMVARGEDGWNKTRVLGVLLKVCEALSYAHSKRVIHRDLKPANIMVGRYGEVYVMDWGLARVLGTADEKDIRVRPESSLTMSRVKSARREQAESAADSPLVTMDGDVLGTPAYMSPEQARGDLEAMGPASDVYSMGAILYQLLAGHMPYVPRDARLNAYAVWALVQNAPPTPVAQLAKDAPVELVAICEKAMAREPRDRYADVRELAEDLRAFLENRVVSAHETGAVPELRKWVSRNRPLAVTSAVAIFALVGGLVASSILYADARNRASEIRRLADGYRLVQIESEAEALWPPHPEVIPQVLALRRFLESSSATVATHENFEFIAPDSALSHQIADLDLDHLRFELLEERGPTARAGWSLPKRLEEARRLEAGFAEGGEFAAAWSDALPLIRAAYPGLDLTPQMGLLPLGPDPDSHLWEFAHLLSGEPAKRDPETRRILPGAETGLVLVLIPGGTFWMGAQSLDADRENHDPHQERQDAAMEGPVHEVNLEPFFLSKFEMTQDQWKRFVGTNPSGEAQRSSPLNPVTLVSATECDEIMRRLGLALPTEEQWEYAARGGTDTPWWTGPGPESLQGAANLYDQDLDAVWPEARRATGDVPVAWSDGYARIAPVGVFRANAFGLHDVLGNVAEWCSTPPYRYEDGPDRAPAEVLGLRMSRGGSSRSGSYTARSTYRGFNADADFASEVVGLRPARAVDP